MSPDFERLSRSMQLLGEATGHAVEAFGEFCRACIDCAVAVLANVDLSRAMELSEALKEAPPKVQHLAKHAKKKRTRKKNANRALREYRRRHKSDKRTAKNL